MSTVVFTKWSIAYDVQMTTGQHREISVSPKVMMSNNAIFTAVGDIRPCHHFIREMVLNEKDPVEIAKEIGDGHEYTVAILTRPYLLQGIFCHYDSTGPWPLYSQLPYAFGTGADYAFGALSMGATAEQACAAAVNYDIHSSLPIQVANMSETIRLMRDVPEKTLRDLHGKPLPGIG